MFHSILDQLLSLIGCGAVRQYTVDHSHGGKTTKAVISFEFTGNSEHLTWEQVERACRADFEYFQKHGKFK